MFNSYDEADALKEASDKQNNGEKIVCWKKEGADYEAVNEKNGKEWGFKLDANGKMLGKHDESKEKGEKGEKY